MHLPDGFWTSVTYVLNIFSLMPVNMPNNVEQTPILGASPNVFSGPSGHRPQKDISSPATVDEAKVHEIAYTPVKAPRPQNATGPVFTPPGARRTGPDSNFNCSYPILVGYEPCFSPENQQCWLRNSATGHEYNITQDYENIWPNGTDRYIELDLTDGIAYNADGLPFEKAKLFNGIYPGPYIEACWGDVCIPLIVLTPNSS